MMEIAVLEQEYATIMSALKGALIAEDFGPRHEELSVLYHTLGGRYGYGEE